MCLDQGPNRAHTAINWPFFMFLFIFHFTHLYHRPWDLLVEQEFMSWKSHCSDQLLHPVSGIRQDVILTWGSFRTPHSSDFGEEVDNESQTHRNSLTDYVKLSVESICVNTLAWGAVESGSKVLATNLITWVQFLEPTWWKTNYLLTDRHAMEPPRSHIHM